MSALERCALSDLSSSYCERRVVIGGAGVAETVSAGCLRDSILAFLVGERSNIVLAVSISSRQRSVY